MTARVYLLPRSVDYIGLYAMCVALKDKGFDVRPVNKRLYVATPEGPNTGPPPVRPPPSEFSFHNFFTRR